jgi:hypothetical protein
MSLTIGTSTGAREALEIHIGTASGAKVVQEGWIGTASGKRQFYSAAPPLSVTVTPELIGWQVVSPGSYYVGSESAYATASGGTPPYAYAWQTNSGSATIHDPNSDNTWFDSSDGTAALATCTVTDADGNTAESNPVSLI